ncbi:hypothetical protein ACFRAE_15355 [Sphingobacterium sp. HJSM2_6]|uniref:hypothetical protein n=1 Tax=Sphingobacterium sp. HJSM2_6 TaxID=3366264 RepID=UPI003BEE77FC
MEKVLAIFIPIALFICITLCVFFISKYRAETITKLGGPIPKLPRVAFPWQKVGIVTIGFALGIILAGYNMQHQIISNNMTEGFAVIGIITLCVGVSMVIAARFKEPNTDEQKNEIDG